jgi:hypothetical protein
MRFQSRHAVIAAALAIAAAIAACTLNPQPLPPGGGDATNAAGGNDSGTRADAGSFETDPETPAPLSDAGTNADSDSGDDDAGDGGDSGDASDAGDSG